MDRPAEAAEELILEGQAASPGIVIGTIHRQPRPRIARPVRPQPAQEQDRLHAALAAARARLAALMAESEGLAADLMEFQLALLDDAALLDPVFEQLRGGATAEAAWREVLGRHVHEYETAEDLYFRARAADLRDVEERVLEALAGVEAGGEAESGPADALYVADELTPSRFLETDWRRFRGAALGGGSLAGHVAMLARARGIPLVVGLGEAVGRLEDGAPAILDAEAGRLLQRPRSATLSAYHARMAGRLARAAEEARHLAGPAVTRDGRRILVRLNIDDLSVIDRLDPGQCDGIGLVRTEFLFFGGALPDEETQFAAYAALARWAGKRPVVIRTLDAGGDKPLAGITPEGERNPFLGLRGVRLCLARPELFRIQLRALARAAVAGNLKIMVPMVTVPEELEAVRALLAEEAASLDRAGVPAAVPPLGMMVEVPAAALTVERFAADFLSIGSNDLVQYVTATSRDNPAVARLHDPLNPAVLALLRRVAAHAAAGVEVSLCGDMAGEPAGLAALLEAGIEVVSVSPAALAATKAAIARHGAG